MKYVLVSGGVVSGLGKGVTASSIGVLLKACDLRVTSIKIDPYLNTDAGTMSPFEHGEVFVLDDGGEADLDLGNYERFLDVTLRNDNNITTGKVYQQVIEKERRGDYLGKTVQVVPHITDAIQDWIERVAHVPVDGKPGPPDVCVIELGGTVGDIESMPFVEALRQFQFRVGAKNFLSVHVSLVPVLGVVGEQKTKPTQHSVSVLRSLGINPHMIACRASEPLGDSVRKKLSLFCQVPESSVLTMHDVTNIWRVPLVLVEQKVHFTVMEHLGLPKEQAEKLNLQRWTTTLAERWDSLTDEVKIAMVGKYTDLSDAYLSVIKALQHGCLEANNKLTIVWIEADNLEEGQEGNKEAWAKLKGCDGVLVPGGFGNRGVEGKILAIQHARESKKPFLGICLGMQMAVVEYMRNVMGLKDVHSTEFNKGAATPAIVFMPEGSTTHKGGTMRLGARRTILETVDCITARLYQADQYIDERHRHRYEVNPEYVERIHEAGLHFVGKDETGTRMEIVELPQDQHPFFVGSQFHPEFKSRPGKPSPLFLGFILASAGKIDSFHFEATPSKAKRPRKSPVDSPVGRSQPPRAAAK